MWISFFNDEHFMLSETVLETFLGGNCTGSTDSLSEKRVKTSHTDLEAGSRFKACRNVHSARSDDHFVTISTVGVAERDCDVTSTRLVLASGGYHHVDNRTKVI